MIDRGPSRLRAFAHKFARFAIVGFVGYLVDAGVLSAFVGAGGDRYSGRVVSFLCAVLVTWRLNRRFVFNGNGNGRQGNALAELSRYLGSSALGGAVNLVTYWLLISLVPLVHAYPSIGVAAGSVAGMTLNFLLYDRAVFVGSKHTQ